MKIKTIEELCILLINDKKINNFFYILTFERHIRDLKELDKEQFRFDEKKAQRYIKITETLTHFKGPLSGKYLKLENWQKAVLGILSGWEELDTEGDWVRRFPMNYIFIARKNGKSIWASGFVTADNIVRPEEGGEVKLAATKKEQAQVVYNGILKQMNRNRELKKNIKIAKGIITYLPTDTTISTLGNESTAEKEDGFNASIGIVDEYSAHGTRALFDIIESSMGARKQPVMFVITTAGFNLGSPSVSEYDHSVDILKGVVKDENYFCFIAAPMNREGIFYEKFSNEALEAANPNIDISVKRNFLYRQRDKAQTNADGLNSYLTKHENRFVASSEVFISLETWKKNAMEEEDIDFSNITDKIIGIDLSITDDMTAIVELFKIDDDEYYLKTMFFIPKENVSERDKTLKIPLEKWIAQGHIKTTEGDFIDYDVLYNYIVDRIEEDLDGLSYNIELRYDPYKAKQLVTRLNNELGFDDTIITRQGFLTLSAPTKLLLDLTKSGKLKHNNNPVMNWMISNFTILIDEAGNIKPNKKERNKKIDGVAATINSIDGIIEKIGEEESSGIIWV